MYSCRHNASCSYFPHICAFMVFVCLLFVTVIHTKKILTKHTNTLAAFEVKA